MTDGDDIPPREAFENQVNNAFTSAMRTAHALWEIKRTLEIDTAGGGVSWDHIRENVWEANEAAGFTQTYVQDETGVVAQWRHLPHDTHATKTNETPPTLTVAINGEEYDVPATYDHPDDLLAHAGYDPDENMLYWSLDEAETEADRNDPIEGRPFAFDDGDRFTVIPNVVEYDDRHAKYLAEAREIAEAEDRQLVSSLTDGYEYQKLPKSVTARRLDADTVIPTLEGVMRVEAGDWVVEGVKGEVYSVADEIFRETYTPVTDDAKTHYKTDG